MKIGTHHKVGARFKLIAHKGDGVPVRETPWFHNLVLDSGLSRMSAGTWIDRCCVGTGNSEPVVAQTALDSLVASTTSTTVSSTPVLNTTTQPYYYGASRTWRFNEGVAAGNISEVGMGWSDTQLWNRALIKDTNGNPTTITVLSDEYLDVISEVRVYFSGTNSGTFDLRDKNNNLISSHVYQMSPSILGTPAWGANKVSIAANGQGYVYSGPKGTPTTAPSGTKTTFTPSLSYAVPKKITALATLGLGNANHQHQSFLIQGLSIMGGNAATGFQVEISPPITKLNTQIMTYTFELGWGRYEPS